MINVDTLREQLDSKKTRQEYKDFRAHLLYESKERLDLFAEEPSKQKRDILNDEMYEIKIMIKETRFKESKLAEREINARKNK